MTEIAEKVDSTAKDETNGVDGATLSIKGPIRDASTVVYTPEEIENHCETIENSGLYAFREGNWHFDSVQIIRQLQQENTELSEIVTVFQET